MKTRNLSNIKKRTGYTIIETMIAVSLFLVVVMYGTTALLNANLLHRKSGDMRSIMDSLSFIMDDMSRNIRVGYDYKCFRKASGGVPGDTLTNVTSSPIKRSCTSVPGWAIAFERSDGGSQSNSNDQWVYSIRDDVDGVGKVWKSTNSATTLVALTPAEVDITDASGFLVLGAESLSEGNLQQPVVTIRLAGNINFKGVITPFSLQTSVSQRLVDNY